MSHNPFASLLLTPGQRIFLSGVGIVAGAKFYVHRIADQSQGVPEGVFEIAEIARRYLFRKIAMDGNFWGVSA